MNKLLVYTLFLIGFFASGVSANSANDWRINGFASQGLSTTSDNQYFGDSDDSVSFDFFEAGLLVQKGINDALSVSAKLAYRAPYSIQRHSASIDHLLLDYHALDGQSWYAGIRLGRVKLIHGFYNTARDTSYTWPTALMNDTIYTNKLLPLYLSTDGINLYFHKGFSDWSVDIEASTGSTDVDSSVIDDMFLLGLDETQSSSIDGLLNAKAEVQVHTWGSRFSLTLLDLESDYDVHIDDLISAKTSFSWRELSLSWQQILGNWQLDAEYLYITNQVQLLESGITSLPSSDAPSIELGEGRDSFTPSGYNLTLHYLYPSGLDIYALMGEFWVNRKDKQGNNYEEQTGVPSRTQYTTNYGLGFIYPLASHWDLAAEVRYNKGTQSLMFADNPLLENQTKKHWSQLFVRATYHF